MKAKPTLFLKYPNLTKYIFFALNSFNLQCVDVCFFYSNLIIQVLHFEVRP